MQKQNRKKSSHSLIFDKKQIVNKKSSSLIFDNKSNKKKSVEKDLLKNLDINRASKKNKKKLKKKSQNKKSRREVIISKKKRSGQMKMITKETVTKKKIKVLPKITKKEIFWIFLCSFIFGLIFSSLAFFLLCYMKKARCYFFIGVFIGMAFNVLFFFLFFFH